MLALQLIQTELLNMATLNLSRLLDGWQLEAAHSLEAPFLSDISGGRRGQRSKNLFSLHHSI
jgi:hypothetical protein